jgi:hypothetical protein
MRRERYVVVMFIRRDAGDPDEAERKYNANFTQRAGEQGRGEDWGVPLVVLHQIRGYASDCSVQIDMFEDQATMESLLYSPGDLPAHLRPATTGVVHAREQVRERGDRVFLNVHKMLPSLRAISTEEGGARRPRY